MLSEIVSVIVTVVLAVLPLFFPERIRSFYVIWALVVFALYLISLCVRLFIANRQLKKKIDEINEANRTLQNGFDKKREMINLYRAGFISLECMLASTMQTSKNDRFATLYKWFLDFKMKMRDDER